MGTRSQEKVKINFQVGTIMKRIIILLMISILGVLKSTAQNQQPNILIIQTDDMGYDDLSVHGNTISHTPNLDAFSESAVRFDNFMVNSVCAPTRASLLTGRDFWRTGVSAMHGGNDYMHLDETTFAEIFQQNGYKTGMWGKWHSGKSDGYWPWDRGFDEGYYARLYNYFPSNGWLNEYPKKTTHEDEWSPKVLVDYAIEFIDRNKEQPFLAYLSFLTCHGIWDAPDDYKNKYMQEGRSEGFATLLGMLEFMDDETGRLLDYLTENGLDENTVVLFLSDNGPIQMNETNAEWELRNNHGFLGNKAQLWQNGLKSPLFVRWKGKYQPADVERLVTVTDIFPTILDIADIPVPENNLPLDGHSFKTYFKGDTTTLNEKSAVFSHWFPVWEEGQFSPLQPHNKAALDFEEQRITLINERYKLLYNPINVNGSPEKFEEKVLIDLQEDPLESTNVAAENQDVVIQMMEELQNWFADIKNEPHSFSPPVFQIAWKGKASSEVRGYGPSKTVGCQNDSHQLIGLNAEGDFAEYKLNVHRSGVYKVSVSVTGANMTGMTLKISCDDSGTESELQNKNFQKIGLIPLEAGEHTLKLEVAKIEAGKSPEINELKAIWFDLENKSLGLSDSLATKETMMLFANLKETGKQGIIFGQHLACYEAQNWRDDEISTDLRSDCKTSVGDHPGVFGFDFGRGVEKFRKYCEEIYRRGGIITYSWHAKNPVTGGNYNDTSGSPVTAILSGGETRDLWLSELDKIADYLNNLEVEGEKVPVIFRPFHENTGSWFWWGTGNCTNREYIDLWRLTMDYLRKEKGVRNMLVAYSPSKPSLNKTLAEEMYPGDNYVDIIGFDAYQQNEALKPLILNSSLFVCEWAQEKNKVPAITEIGIRKGIQNSMNPDWFNSGFYDLIRNEPVAKNVAYALTWMNTSPDSYWVPLPGQPTYDGFKEFYNDSTTYFLNDIANIYSDDFFLSKDSAVTPKVEKAMLKLRNVNGNWVWRNQDGIIISTAGFITESGNIVTDTTSDDEILISSVYTAENNILKIAGENGSELPPSAFIGSGNSNPVLRIIYKTDEQVQGIFLSTIEFDGQEEELIKSFVFNASAEWDTIVFFLDDLSKFQLFANELILKTLSIWHPSTLSGRLALRIKEIACGTEELFFYEDNLTAANIFFRAENGMNIYPNPAIENVTINIDSPQINQIKIFDRHGKFIRKLDVQGQQNTFNLNIKKLRAGIYFLTANAVDGSMIKRYRSRLVKINCE